MMLLWITLQLDGLVAFLAGLAIALFFGLVAFVCGTLSVRERRLLADEPSAPRPWKQRLYASSVFVVTCVVVAFAMLSGDVGGRADRTIGLWGSALVLAGLFAVFIAGRVGKVR